MFYSLVSQLRYANAGRTAIDCFVAFDKFASPLPFTASPDDSEAHGREIFAKAVAGQFGAVAPFIEE